MAQVDVYDPEVSAKLKGVVEMFESELFPTMRTGVENCLEYGQSADASSLVAAAEAAREGTEQMIKIFTELCENIEKYNALACGTNNILNGGGM